MSELAPHNKKGLLIYLTTTIYRAAALRRTLRQNNMHFTTKFLFFAALKVFLCV